jgi:hypothetical protein
MLLIHQHQARNLSQQHKLQQLFLTFVAGQLTAEQYERNLDLTSRLRSDRRTPLNAILPAMRTPALVEAGHISCADKQSGAMRVSAQ